MKAKIIKLIDKNFKLILRSKVSSLIIFFGPLLVLFLAGFAFSSSDDLDLQIGVHYFNETNLTVQFIDSLSERFIVFEYDERQDCIDDVRSLVRNGCIGFSPDFELADGSENIVTLYVDNSQVNIVDLIQNSINSVIFAQTSTISADLTTVLLTSINDVSQRLTNWRSNINTNIIGLQNELLTSIDSSSSQLSDIDSDTSDSQIVLNALTTNRDSVDATLSQAKNKADDAIRILDRLIRDVEDTNHSNSAITSITNNARSDLQDLERANNQSTNIQDFIQTMDNAISFITDMSERLERAGQVRSDLNQRFTQNRELISDTRQQLTIMAVEMEVTNTVLSNIKITDAQSIVNPVISTVEPVTTTNSRLDYIFPSLMILVIMFVSIMLGATMVVIEKLSPAKFRLFTTPTADITFITSIFISTIVVAIYQITLLLFVAEFVFAIDVFSNIHNSLPILLFAAIIFTLLGMGIGYLFSNEQTTILAAISLGSAFILVSDLILPLETISESLQQYIIFTPFVLLSSLLRRTMLFEASMFDFLPQLGIVFGISVLLFVLIIGTHKLLKFIFLFNHLRYKAPKVK
ncbi:MAG: ABC transporter permease [Candidatus Woesearchaeota archaeon]